MTNDDKLLQALEALQADINGLKTDISGVKQDLTTVKKDMLSKEDLTTGLHELAEDISESFHETWARMDVETARITRLEEKTELTNRN